MKEFRADLHCHTTCSDGTLSPEEIVLLASQTGLKGLSITDHDTVEAYSTAIPAAQKAGVELISGAEFTTVHEGETIHVLAYAFVLHHPAIEALCLRHAERRLNRTRAILALLKERGMPIEEETLYYDRGVVGRPHIAQAMVEKGYVVNIAEAFHKYLADGKPCYVQGKPISTKETIDIIHEAKGFAVMAHPHLIKNQQRIPRLLLLDFDGIEAYYAKFLPNKEKQWVKIGKERGLLITGGSDFHGDSKPSIPLGASWVGPDIFEILRARYNENCHE